MLMRKMASCKRYVLYIVAVTVVVWSTKVLISTMTYRRIETENVDYTASLADLRRKNVGHVQTQTVNYIGEQAEDHIGRNIDNPRWSQTDNLVENKADDNIRSQIIKSNMNKAGDIGNSDKERSQTVNNKESRTGDLVGSKANGNKGSQTRNNVGSKTSILAAINPGGPTGGKFQDFDKALAHVKETIKNDRCNKHKKTHITFLKVHKAGSTTMEYMFYRFGMRHNLTFVLPKTGVYALVGGKSDDIWPVKEGENYDILACHSIYNRTKFKRLLPEDSLKIAIIRDPLERMVSAAYYYRDVIKLPYLLKVPKENFIVNLIRNHANYENEEFSRTKNSMAKDFGFPAKTTKNMTELISKYIKRLAIDFNLVLIMERLEESLIMMKRYLGWELFDILFIAANKHEHGSVSLKAADMETFKSVSFLDYAIYEEFSRILDWKIRLEEETFKDEVEHFKTVLGAVNEFCDGQSGFDFLRVPGTMWTCPFIVTALDCQFLKMDPNVISLPILIERHKKMQGYI